MSMNIKKTRKPPFQCLLIGLVALASTPVFAAPLSLETTPLFTTSYAKPNLILSIDDSGSMDSEVLFPSNDGALWWNTSTNRFDSAGAVNYNTGGSASGNWMKYTYLFPNGTGTGKRVYADSTNYHFAIPPIVQYAFARSIQYNKMYYNPDSTYEPWADYGTNPNPFSDITETAAPSDPVSGSSTLNLVTNRYSSNSNEVFKMYTGMKIPAGTYYNGSIAASDIAATNNSNVAIRYYPATYYVKKATGTFSVGTGGSLSMGDCSAPSASLYDTFHNEPSTLSGSDVDSLGPDGGCLTKVEIAAPTNSYANSGTRTDCAIPANCTYAEEIQNFANWYSYSRKRHIALRAGMGQAFVGFSAIRTGIFTINSRSNVTMWDMETNSDTFYSNLYDIDGNGGGTPNRRAMNYAGQQFERTDINAPITEVCQKNFTLFFTDGFASDSSYDPALSSNDSSQGTPYEDAVPHTIADTSWHYYSTNLRPDLTAGHVPEALGCGTTPIDPQLDCNANLHMNTYTVGMGANGTIFGVSHNEVADAYITAPTWPNVNGARDNTQVDDLYHAAVNGRGEMYNATSADELQDKLKAALLGIQASIGVASAVTFNTATLETNSAVYLAFFNSANWSGDLNSFDLSSTGELTLTPSWSAANILDSGSPVSYNTRTIITHDGADGIPFRWDTTVLTTAQQADLNAAPDGDGSKALDFIRGKRDNEGPGKYRVRGSILGDIVNAAPVFAGVPSLSWPAKGAYPTTSHFPTAVGSRYSDFRNGLLPPNARTEAVYVGANDGMLHGFNAATGAEILAYIPSFAYSASANKGLHYLAEPTYAHNYYVDLAPTVSDVYINTGSGNAWHSILIGGGRAGGKGLFALDVTDPSDFSEANAADIALWEFTHADLGYTYSKPTIVMMNNGKWAAIFGNGYNDTGATGYAKLFILYLEGGIDGTWTPGTDYKIISTDVGSTGTPNGLATPAVVDFNGDGTADRAYAGDLEGNMWAFDLSSTSDSSWDVAYTSGGSPAPLFTATDSSATPQPITQKPSVAFHPDPPTGGSHDPNLMVFFGTGKYLESSDLTTTDSQSFYGIWDDGTDSISRSDLIEQSFTTGSFSDSDGKALRLISDNAVNYSNKMGWFIDLPATGERSVVDSQIRGSLVFFNTWIPSSSPCGSGGSGFLMSVEMLNGGEPDSPAFNVNSIAGVDGTDVINDGTYDRNASGQSFDNGLPARSTFLSNKQYTPGTGGTVVQTRDVADLGGGATGRISWQELQRD